MDVSTVRISNPGDLIASIPALLGFEPEGVVAVFTNGNHLVCTSRIDAEDVAMLPQVAERVMAQVEATDVIVVAYAEPKDDLCAAAVEISPIVPLWTRDVLAAWTVDGEPRFRSMLCDNDDCCPLAGKPVPTITQLDAERVYAGMAPVAGSREEYAARLTPRPDLAPSPQEYSEAMTQAMTLPASAVGPRLCRAIWDGEAAMAAVLANSIHVRDVALAMLCLPDADTRAAGEAAAQIAVRTIPAFAPMVASLAAALLAAGGDGVSARTMVERAEGTSLAPLVTLSLDAAMPPDSLRDIFTRTLGESLERLAESWGQ